MARKTRNRLRSDNFDIIGKKTGFHSITPPMHQKLRDDQLDSALHLSEAEHILGGQTIPLSLDGTLSDAALNTFFTGKIDAAFMTAMGVTRKNIVNFLNYLFNNLGEGGTPVPFYHVVDDLAALEALDVSNATTFPEHSLILVLGGPAQGFYILDRDNTEEEFTETTYYLVVRDTSDTHTFFRITNMPARFTKGATAPFELISQVYGFYNTLYPYLMEPHMQTIVGGEPESLYLRMYVSSEVDNGNTSLLLQTASKGFVSSYTLDKLTIVNLDTKAVEGYLTLPSKIRTGKLNPEKNTLVYVGQNGNVYYAPTTLSGGLLPTSPTLVAYDVAVTDEWVFYSQENLTQIGYFSLTAFGGHTTITLAHNAWFLLMNPENNGFYAIGSNGVSYIDVDTKAVTQLVNSGSFVTYLTSAIAPYFFRSAGVTATHFFVLARTAALNQYNLLRFNRSTHAYEGATAGNFGAVFADPESEAVFVHTSATSILNKLNPDFSLDAGLNIGSVGYPGFFYDDNLYVGGYTDKRVISPSNTQVALIPLEGERWYKDESLSVAYGLKAADDGLHKLQLSFIDLEKNEAIPISENGVYQLSADKTIWLKQTYRGAAVQSGAVPADLSERIGEVESLTSTHQATLDLQAAQIADLQTGGQGLEQFPIQNGLTVGRVYYKTGDSTYVGASPALESTSKMRGIVVGTSGGDLIGRLAGSSLTTSEISALNATGLSINSFGTFYLGNTGTPDTSFVTTEGYFMKVVIENGNVVDSPALEIGLESYISRNETTTGTDTVPSYVDRMTVVVTSAGTVSRTPSLVNEDVEAVAEGQQLLYIKKGAGVLTVVGTFNGVTDFTLNENQSQLLEFADGAWWKI